MKNGNSIPIQILLYGKAIAFLPGTMIWWPCWFNVAIWSLPRQASSVIYQVVACAWRCAAFLEQVPKRRVSCWYSLPPRLGNHNLKKSKLKWHVPALEYSCKASYGLFNDNYLHNIWPFMVQDTSMLANNRHWPLRHYVIITSLFPSHPQGNMPSPNTWDTAADAPEACHASVVLRVPCTALRPWPRWGRCGWGWHRLAAPRLIQFRYNVRRAIRNHAQ